MSRIDFMMCALNVETDFLKFEKVALEVMAACGYNDIKPFGGYKDKGIDALNDNLYDGKLKERVIFQFSTDINSVSKVERTLKKLKENNIEYTNFVYATSKKVTSTDKIRIDEIARKFNVVSTIFDQETICFYLDKDDAKLWLKYYQDPVNLLLKEKEDENFFTASDPHKKEILKAFFIFFQQRNDNSRKQTFINEIILSYCASMGNEPIDIEKIKQACEEKFKLAIDLQSLRSTITGLVADKKLERKGNGYIANATIASNYLTATSKITNSVNLIGYQIIGKINSASDSVLTDSDKGRILNITNLYIIEVLKRYAIDIVNSMYAITSEPISYDANIITTSEIFSPLSDRIKKLFIIAAHETLTSNDDTVIQTLHLLAMSYTTMYALGIDPYLQELHASKLNNKQFIIDTDFILDALVKEGKEYAGNCSILEQLHKAGAEVIIPLECLEECALHAKIANRTYYYFGDALTSTQEDMVESVVLNVFVKGFYYAKKQKKHLTFEYYLKNYFAKENPLGFLIRIVEETLPFVHIKKLDELSNIDMDSEQYISTFELIKAHVQASRKAQYRNQEEIENIARVDAKLFLTVINKNDSSSSRSPYKLNAYVVTKSFAFNISARIQGIDDKVSTTKQALTAYFNIFTNNPINKRDIAHFIFDPVTNFVTAEMKDDLKKLARLGFDISDLSLVRLGYDIDESIHNLLQGFTDDSSMKEYINSGEYSELVKFANIRGYRQAAIVTAIADAKDKIITKVSEERDSAIKERDRANDEAERAKIKLRKKKRHDKRTLRNKNKV